MLRRLPRSGVGGAAGRGRRCDHGLRLRRGASRSPSGGQTSLSLSSEYVWDEPVVEGDAVELGRVDYLQDPGFSEWTVGGVRPGTAAISSLGTPACDGEHGCPDEPVRFRVTITVAG